jgi:hypothetical protein
MKMNIVLGASACLLSLAMSLNASAQAYSPPPYPCNANNVGEVYSDHPAYWRPGSSFRVNVWECSASGWFYAGVMLCVDGDCYWP